MIEFVTSPRIITRLVIAAIVALLVSSCSTPLTEPHKVKGLPRLADKHYVSYDNDQFGYKKWLPTESSKKDPSVVIVAVHGISGHSGDYENMAKHLLKSHADVALYAAETRGQGMDAKRFRRGDISKEGQWYKDLYTFTRLIRERHPLSKIVWLGESMGSLIVMHAYRKTPPWGQKPDALILSSPIVGVKSKLPAWKMATVRLSALLMPKLRVSLETLSGGERAVVTADDIHEQQAAKNPWYIRRYTLRLLLTLGDMAEDMDQVAKQVHCPVLVLHGGKDIFTEEQNVREFYQQFPATTKKSRKYYPGSYHLLMYDHDRDRIFKDVSGWLNRQGGGRSF